MTYLKRKTLCDPLYVTILPAVPLSLYPCNVYFAEDKAVDGNQLSYWTYCRCCVDPAAIIVG